MYGKTSLRSLSLALLLTAPGLASGISLAEGKLYINGNGQWSYQLTDRADTAYLQGDSDGDWHTAMFDLLTVAKPTDDLTVNAQMGFEGEGVELEWAFIEWRHTDALRFRAGKVKQPFGNYAELQFVGTGRPLYDLPTSVYGPAGIIAEAYQGVGFTGDIPFADGWSFQYDVWGGAMVLPTYEQFDLFNGEVDPAAVAVEPPSVEEMRVENIVGARASVVMPNGWTFRLSGYGGRSESNEGEEATHLAVGASAWYRGEKLWLSAEAAYGSEHGFEETTSGYLEAAWFLTERVQVAGRYEILRADVEGLDGTDPLEKHDSVTAGVGYWLTPGAVLRASVDYVNGSRFLAREEWNEVAEEGGTIDFPAEPARESAVRFVLGAQFTF